MKTIEEKAKECATRVLSLLCSDYAESDEFLKGTEKVIIDAFTIGAQAVQEWISVDDELPEYGQIVICKYDDIDPREVGYFVAQYVDDMFYINDEDVLDEDHEPSHWRPIECK